MPSFGTVVVLLNPHNYTDNIYVFTGLIIIPISLSIFFLIFSKKQITEELASSIKFRITLFVVLYVALVVAIILILKADFDINVIVSICLLYVFICVSILIISKPTANDIGITVSCIPIRFKDNDYLKDEIEIYLVENSNFNDGWRLPCGHAQLKDMENLDVLEKRIKKEAGLKISMLEPPEKSNDSIGWRTISGLHHFTYFLNLEEGTVCSKNYGHKKHIDFMFVGKVEEIENNENEFLCKRISIELNLKDADDITPKNISKKIGEALQKKGYKMIHMYNDVPKRIEIALKAYIDYKKSLSKT